MKAYFTKYLPVEGEMKEGDKYKCAGSEEVRTCKSTYREDAETGKGERFLDTTLWSMSLQKVELFLCSADIQPNDKKLWVYDQVDHIWIENPEEVFCLSVDEGKIIMKSEELGLLSVPLEPGTEVIKVLGEISPEALTFVKEGDEFDENEVKKSSLPICPKCGAPGGNDGFCPEEVECETDKQRIIFYIKGPCGHFH